MISVDLWNHYGWLIEWDTSAFFEFDKKKRLTRITVLTGDSAF